MISAPEPSAFMRAEKPEDQTKPSSLLAPAVVFGS